MSSTHMTLNDLRAGERGVIVDIDGHDAVAARLMEMGLLPGETVEMIGAAPMGDPIEYAVYGYRISLRSIESARVRIDKA
jgi:ferrous iron transport protein A